MKRVVVTGGSRGIGLAIAERFLQNGDAAIICGRNQTVLSDAGSSLREKHPHASLETFACDVADRQQLENLARFVSTTFNGTDILINNAGIFLPGQVHNEEEGVLEQLFTTNVASAYHLTRMLLPGMMERREGHIFNMCSTASIMPYVNGGSYCITKFALLGMTKVLREEMKEFNIKVTAIMPGATLTDSWRGTDLPEERFMKAADVAQAVFMAANLSDSADVEEILLRPVKGDI